MEASVFVPWKGWTAVKTLGQGGFGKVYEIQRTKGGVTERAAMKVITIPKDTSEVEYLEAAGYDEASITNRFDSYKENVLREYGIMAKMKGNTNIVYCDDVEEIRRQDSHGWNIYIKMELLTPLLKSMDSVKEELQIIRLGKDLCGALIACQKQNIIHRDIKPQNVFVGPDGTFKLGDFGIARTLEHTTRATAGIGTYNYMAPEVLHKKAYNQSVDIYSLGLMLYWLLNARRGPFMPLPPAPMTHSAEEESFSRRMSGEAIPAPMSGSPALKRIVLKACAFDPQYRYQTAEAMLRDLNSLSGGSTVYTDRTVMEEKTVYDATVLDGSAQKVVAGSGPLAGADKLVEVLKAGMDKKPPAQPYHNVGAGKVEYVNKQPQQPKAEPYRNAGQGKVDYVKPLEPVKIPKPPVQSQPYRNAGVGNVEQVKQAPQQPKAAPQPQQPPKAAPQQPKSAPAPKAKPKKKAKSVFVWLILIILGAIGILVNSPELQDKLGIHLTTSDAPKAEVVLSEDSDTVAPNARGPALSEVLASGECERIYYADGSCMDMYYDEYDQERIRIFYGVDGEIAFQFEAEYNSNGDMLLYRAYENGKLMQTTQWTYNSDGDWESMQITDGSGLLKEHITRLYEDGKLIRVESRDASDAITSISEHIYNADGTGKTVVMTNSDGSSDVWIYDEKDQCLEYRTLNAQGNLEYRVEYTYNSDGQQVEQVHYDAQDVEEYRKANTYNDKGQLHKAVLTWSDGSVSEYTYSYNDRGVETEETVRNSYTYDGSTETDLSTLQWVEDMQGTILRYISKRALGEMYIMYYTVLGDRTATMSFDIKGEPDYREEFVLDENGKTVEIRTISYYDDGSRRESVQDASYNDISFVEYDADGKKKRWMDSAFDEQGRVSEQETFRADGSVEYHTRYKYLEDGTLDLITKTYFSNYDNSTTEYLYDANWKTQYSCTMDETGIIYESYYTYNELGELESYKDINYYSDGRYAVSMSNGNYCRLWEKIYDANDVLLSEMEYDAEGRASKEIFYDAYGNVTSWDEYVRNSDGDLEKVITHE